MRRSFSELLEWQWSDYARRHRSRSNLIIHIIAVPLFWIGAIGFVYHLLFSGLIFALSGALLMGASLFAQGKGHEAEAEHPEPFQGAWDFACRVGAEQFITFPRFVVSGAWYRNLRKAV